MLSYYSLARATFIIYYLFKYIKNVIVYSLYEIDEYFFKHYKFWQWNERFNIVMELYWLACFIISFEA